MSSIFGCPKEFKAANFETAPDGSTTLKGKFNLQNFLANVRTVIAALPVIIQEIKPIIDLFKTPEPPVRDTKSPE